MKKVTTRKQKVEVEVDVPVVIDSDSMKEFEDAFGQEVCLFGVVYIYAGKLVGVNDTHVVLRDAGIVYETGPFTDNKWRDFQKLPAKEVKVRKSAVESWFVVNRQ